MERIADADYAGQQYSALLGGGYTLSKGALAFTPLASLQYMHLRLNSYTETGAGALNLHVDGQQFDLLQSGLGFKMEYPLKLKSNTFIPEVHFKWLFDFIGDKQQTTSTFSGGGASFRTSGFAPERISYNAGTKMTFLHHNNFDLSFTYDYQFKKNYSAHTGMLRAKLAF